MTAERRYWYTAGFMDIVEPHCGALVAVGIQHDTERSIKEPGMGIVGCHQDRAAMRPLACGQALLPQARVDERIDTLHAVGATGQGTQNPNTR